MLEFYSMKVETMEKSSTPRSTAEGGLFSCWGCLKLKLPWAKRSNSYRSVGGFNYDPLSYSQNFDEGYLDEDEVVSRRGFSARYAAPSTKSIAHK